MDTTTDRDATVQSLLDRCRAASTRARDAEAREALARDMLDQEIGRTHAVALKLEEAHRVARRLRGLLATVLACAEQGETVPHSVVSAAIDELNPEHEP